MDCKSVMGPVTRVLNSGDTAETAINAMAETHDRLIPVVGEDGGYVGMVSAERLMHRLVPRAVTLMRKARCMGFLRERPDELRARLESLNATRLADLLDTKAAAVGEDDALIAAMTLIGEGQAEVPVLDVAGRVAGIISFDGLLKFLEESNGNGNGAGPAAS